MLFHKIFPNFAFEFWVICTSSVTARHLAVEIGQNRIIGISYDQNDTFSSFHFPENWELNSMTIFVKNVVVEKLFTVDHDFSQQLFSLNLIGQIRQQNHLLP